MRFRYCLVTMVAVLFFEGGIIHADQCEHADQDRSLPKADASAVRTAIAAEVEILAAELNFPSSVETDDEGNVWVALSGAGHSAIRKIDQLQTDSALGEQGDLFIALFGNMAPKTGTAPNPPGGMRVMRYRPSTKEVTVFAEAKEPIPTDWTAGIRRPLDVTNHTGCGWLPTRQIYCGKFQRTAIGVPTCVS